MPGISTTSGPSPVTSTLMRSEANPGAGSAICASARPGRAATAPTDRATSAQAARRALHERTLNIVFLLGNEPPALAVRIVENVFHRGPELGGDAIGEIEGRVVLLG